MKIALVGYGKMGHMIEQCAKNAGHEVVVTIDTFAEDASVKIENGDTDAMVRAVKSSGAEGIIEFSHPTAVMQNIKALLPLGLPLVVGTTGWNDKKDEVNKFAADCGGVIMTSANFSIGVNMFYKIVAEAAKILNMMLQLGKLIIIKKPIVQVELQLKLQDALWKIIQIKLKWL